ncbi:hypothetical protein P5673_032160, partial [Acropora cervicornis]
MTAWTANFSTTRISREEPTSKDQKATSLRTLGCHKPVTPEVTCLTPLAPHSGRRSKGSIGRALAVVARTGGSDRASFCPFVRRRISVLPEPTLGHLRCSLTD